MKEKQSSSFEELCETMTPEELANIKLALLSIHEGAVADSHADMDRMYNQASLNAFNDGYTLGRAQTRKAIEQTINSKN